MGSSFNCIQYGCQSHSIEWSFSYQVERKIKLSVCRLSVCLCVCVNEIPTLIFYVRTLSEISMYSINAIH
jgi:hypothetical protein